VTATFDVPVARGSGGTASRICRWTARPGSSSRRASRSASARIAKQAVEIFKPRTVEAQQEAAEVPAPEKKG